MDDLLMMCYAKAINKLKHFKKEQKTFHKPSIYRASKDVKTSMKQKEIFVGINR